MITCCRITKTGTNSPSSKCHLTRGAWIWYVAYLFIVKMARRNVASTCIIITMCRPHKSKSKSWICIISVIVLCLIINPTSGDDEIPLKLSFLSSTSNDAKLFAGAFFSAFDVVTSNSSILQGYRLEYLFNDTKSSSLNAINAMTSHYGNDTIGFIGPDVSCECESTVAAAWNLPMIGYVSCSFCVLPFS